MSAEGARCTHCFARCQYLARTPRLGSAVACVVRLVGGKRAVRADNVLTAFDPLAITLLTLISNTSTHCFSILRCKRIMAAAGFWSIRTTCVVSTKRVRCSFSPDKCGERVFISVAGVCGYVHKPLR